MTLLHVVALVLAQSQPGSNAAPAEAPASKAPATDAPAAEAPATEAPAAKAPATEAPAAKAPATEAPAAKAPATEAPAAKAPATQAPATETPATKAPAAKAPATESPATDKGTASAASAEEGTSDTAKDDNAQAPPGFLEWLYASAPATDLEAARAGAGVAQLRIAERLQKQRDEKVAAAQAVINRLLGLVEESRQATNNEAKTRLRTTLRKIAEKPMDEAQALLEESVRYEKARTTLLRKAAAIATERNHPLLGLTPDDLQRYADELDKGVLNERLTTRIAAFRDVAAAIGAFLANDLLGAIARLTDAEKKTPDLGVVHVYLGSFLFLARQETKAVNQWKKALAIDPSNEEIRQALRAFAGN